MYVGVVGREGRISSYLPNNFEILFHNPILAYGEVPTLAALHQQSLKDDFWVLYLHTKGVSYQEQGYDKAGMTAWRHYLEHFCINKWQECVSHLDKFDAVGCEYVKERKTPKGPFPGHFRGNFWWSKSSYLRTLPRVINIDMPSTELRRKGEYWVGSGKDFKPKSLFNLPGEQGQRGWLYKHVLDPKTYA
jgi:hypothetical protein